MKRLLMSVVASLWVFSTTTSTQVRELPSPAGTGSSVDISLLDDGGALVCWLEKLPEGGAVRVRRIRPDSKLDEAITVAPSGTARSNDYERGTTPPNSPPPASPPSPY